MPHPEPVLVVEGGTKGHWLRYVAYLVDHAHAAGLEAHVALRPQALDSDEYRIALSGLVDRSKVHALSPFSMAGAEDVARKIGARLVVLPSGDEFLAGMVRPGRFAGASVSILLMRTRWQRDAGFRGALRTVVKNGCVALLAVRPRVRVFGLRSALARAPEGSFLRRPRPALMRTVPDPATLHASPEVANALRAAWTLTPDVRWFGVFGAISARKNLPAVVEALRRDAAGRFGLVVAGRFEPDLAEEISGWRNDERLAGRIVIDDRVLSDVEFDSAFLAVDGVIVAHTNEGPSGVLGKAALSGTPVVAAGAQSLRQEALDHPTLALWVPLTADDLLRGMERVTALERAPQPLSATLEQFSGPLLRLVDRPGPRG